jgi:hypothetical protein
MGKRNTMGGQDIFKYLGYNILYNGNTIVRKFRDDMEVALNHTYRLMSNFLHSFNQ